ncbi:MAG: hypothetical protein R3F37_17975 [Candidatus Competibacteraceae bacterium]
MIRRLAVPSLRHLDYEKRWIKKIQGIKPYVLAGRIQTIAAADLIRKAHDPEKMAEKLAVVFAEARPSFHVRLARIK